MSKRVPKHVREIYGSAHKFRASKRRAIVRLIGLVKELQRGCAFFPCGPEPIQDILSAAEIVRKATTTRTWGK